VLGQGTLCTAQVAAALRAGVAQRGRLAGRCAGA